jgi:hypothetical protein
VKVCPHCAEELPDGAVVCPQCRKDPGVSPEWTRSSHDATFWRSPPAEDPDAVPSLIEQKLASSTEERPRTVADLIRDKLPVTGGRRIPSIVWVSFGMWAFSRYAWLFGTATIGAFIITMFCLITGLVLGVVARRQIRPPRSSAVRSGPTSRSD